MITGFNTDIEFKGITYHVQTEDKGLSTPFILSLIYDGGTILASKRSPYDDLVQNFDENILAERLQKQHKLICAAIRAGRLEDLKKMSRREVLKRKQDAGKSPVSEVSESEEHSGERLQKQSSESLEKEKRVTGNLLHDSEMLAGETESIRFKPKNTNSEVSENSSTENALPPVTDDNRLFLHDPEVDSEFHYSIDLTQDDLIIDDPNSEEEFVFPSEGVEIITEKTSQPVRKIFEEESDEDLLETDSKESPQVPKQISDKKIRLDILDEKEYRGGQSEEVKILVTRGETDVIPYAHIVIKVLGTNFRPIISHTKTDRNGLASVQINIPDFSRGRAALLVKAVVGTEETETRKVISPN